ncbi:MAG: HAD-IIIA family hydrolase, partial [Planctomycetota bacterium]
MTDPTRRAVFFDRDGTLVDTLDYLGKPEAVVLLPGSADVLKQVGEAGWKRVIVTNQSGVARGYFTEDEYRVVEGRFLELVREGGGDIDASYACFHLSIGAVP